MSRPTPRGGLVGGLILLFLAESLSAAGIYRDGATARSMSLGGATTASAEQPLDALQSNPATLSNLHKTTLDLNAGAGFLDGKFSNRANPGAKVSNSGFFGAAAIAVPVGPVRFALGVSPDATSRVDWRYRDTPGGADGATTYGERDHESEIVVLRTALGLSWAVTPEFSVGASVGLLYNHNRLNAPYIFQSQPVLRTLKTLLDLDTEGYGWNAQVGLLWKPLETFSLGVAYTSASRVDSTGTAKGNANVQLARIGLGAARPDFQYDAEVRNHFPQQISVGLMWKVQPQLTLHGQIDWVDWSSAFDTLEVRLSKGNNRDMNALVGSNQLEDNVPLNWRDQYVFRSGLEWAVSDRWTLRGGYTYARGAVPEETLSPLTAAIGEHTLGAGVGYRFDWATVDLAYQYTLPKSVHVDRSILAGGEYSESTTRVGVQWLGLTTKIEF